MDFSHHGAAVSGAGEGKVSPSRMLSRTGRAVRTEPRVCINQLISNANLSRLSSRSSISRTIRMYDMPTMRIRRDWPGEFRLGRLAMDLASSVSVPLSAVPPEISRLVLESLMPPAPSLHRTVWPVVRL